MSAPVLEPVRQDRWNLSGDLDFKSVPAAWKLLKPLLDKEKKVVLSLQGVAHANSAA